ncbi:MAG: glutathione peroxidase [Acetobacteraceae bacterium]|nr:glutathione peroxidase [Acetobacteraceae bacterium]
MAEASRRAALLAALTLPAMPASGSAATAFDFGFEALEGGPLPLASFRGRVLLVVNTASFCGYTPQYAALQRLHDRHEGRGLTVIGVPSNDFNQESTDTRRVREFCDTMFGITFPMAAISHVRGERAHPFFQWAAREAGPVRWNFHKYLVHRDGRRVQGFSTQTAPDAPALTRALDAALAASPSA